MKNDRDIILDRETSVKHYIKDMKTKLLSLFDWYGIPDEIPYKQIDKSLFDLGRGVFFRHTDDKFYFLPYANGGEIDAYGNPLTVVVSSHAFREPIKLTVGNDCVIFKNDSYASSIDYNLSKYGHFIHDSDITINLLCRSLRNVLTISASDNKTIESARRYIDGIERGKLGIIAETPFLDGVKIHGGSVQNAILTQFLEVNRYYKACALNDFGISANWNGKREYISSTESEKDTSELYHYIDNMIDERRNAINKANSLFGLDMSIEFSSEVSPETDEKSISEVKKDDNK